MTSIAKLKDRARKHELKEDWQAAIEAYRKVLEAEEGQDELELELGLYNRVGDLHLRLGQTEQAVTYYERAADKYAEAGFYNNAIALCNKALRHRPQRAELYLKLSRLSSEQGFLPDARRWILEYAERQVRLGNVEDALTALEDFAGSNDDPDVRELLARHLASHDREDEAVSQLQLAYAGFTQAGDSAAAERVAERARELDPAVELSSEADVVAGDLGPTELPGLEPPEEEEADQEESGELVLETHRQDEVAPAAGGALEGLESGAGLAEAEEEEQEEAATEGLAGFEATAQEEPEEETAQAEGLGGLETFVAEEDPDAEVLDAPGAGVEPVAGAGLEEEPGEEEAEPLPLLETGFEEEPGEDAEPLPLLEGGEEGEAAPVAGDPEAVEEVEPLEAGLHEPEVAEPEVAEPEVAEPEVAEPEVAEPEVAPAEPESLEPESLEPEPLEPESLEPEPLEPDRVEPEERQEIAAAGQEEPAADAMDLEGVGDLGGRDLGGFQGTEGAGDDPMEGARKYGIEPVDLNVTDLSFGPSDMTGDPTDMLKDVDVEAVLTRARELVARALMSEALRELSLLSGGEPSPEVARQALSVASEIVRHDANNLSALQARVEFAAQTHETGVMVDAYLDLADALARLGSETKANAMYQRVLDLDPGNEAAREALGEEGEAGEEAVDVESLLRDMEPQAGSAEVEEPADPEFAALLSQLRTRAGEETEGADAGDHYNLGLAFKEMGLIDEAIGEFQTALRAGEEGLRVYEELGQCFVLNRQFTVALKVFKRALQINREDESDLLGVYYLLGQCYEELGQREEARDAYEKVLAIDESFADVPDRVARL